MPDNPERGLIPRQSLNLAALDTARNRILVEMVANSLAVAKESAPSNTDLDILVGEAKRIQRREGMAPEDIQAFRLFHQAAVAGHAEAQYLVSECYGGAFGIQRNLEREWEWLHKSGESGFVTAQSLLGVCCFPLPEAMKWCQQAALQGDMFAECRMGLYCELGFGLPKDDAEAAKWYLKAADKGLAEAQRHLASCYREGRGVTQCWLTAAKWYRDAAENGDILGQWWFALCCGSGNGVEFDIRLAYAWTRLAIDRKRQAFSRIPKRESLTRAEALEINRYEELNEYMEDANESLASLANGMDSIDLDMAQHLYRGLKEYFGKRPINARR